MSHVCTYLELSKIIILLLLVTCLVWRGDLFVERQNAMIRITNYTALRSKNEPKATN